MKTSKQRLGKGSWSLRTTGEAFETEERLSVRKPFGESRTESFEKVQSRSLPQASLEYASKARKVDPSNSRPEGAQRLKRLSKGKAARGTVSSDFSALTRNILAWYSQHRRDLPWRAKAGEGPNPYYVWLSEIMLQQTTVATVRPYFLRFVAQWPTVEALAMADLDAVRTAWSGLGYYSRATRLHQTAQKLAAQAVWPQTPSAWVAYPGIGAYTSAAISAIAFGFPAVPVDGNIARLFQRLFAGAGEGEARLKWARWQAEAWAQAVWQEEGAPESLTDSHEEEALPPSQSVALRKEGAGSSPLHDSPPGDLAQALMDLGATVCLPRNPRCEACPLRSVCPFDFQISRDSVSKAPSRSRRLRHGYALGLCDCLGRIYVEQETEGRLLPGLMKVPLIDLPDVPVDAPLCFVRGIFSHFTWNVGVIRLRLTSGQGLEGAEACEGECGSVSAKSQPATALSKATLSPWERTEKENLETSPVELTWEDALLAAEADGLDLEALPFSQVLRGAFPYRLTGEWLTKEELTARPQSALLRKILRTMES